MTTTIIEKLLAGADIEWKPLGEIAEIGTGNSNRDDEKEGGKYPLYVRSKYILATDQYEFDEIAIIIPGEGGIGDIFHYVNGKYALHQRAYRIHIIFQNIIPKYIFYYMFSKFKRYIMLNIVGSTSLSIRKPMLQNFMIPIPPLSVQKEIVRILDAFTAHTAELTAELTERQKQYNYYRDKLLTFSDNEVEWKTLGEIAYICDGAHQTPKYTRDGIPFVSVQNINNLYSTRKYISDSDFIKYKYKPMKNDILMTRIGDIGTCAMVETDEPLAYYVTLALIHIKDKLIFPKYIKYIIESSIGIKQLKILTLINAVPIKINLKDIGRIEIPIPPLSIQKEIVRKLDAFSDLTTSITEGLPREIELRNKQYEYYRDQLLNFPKPEDKVEKQNACELVR